MEKILRHPVLKEPAKWVPRLRQQHSLDLELRGFYDVNALNCNPLVQGLEAVQSSIRASREKTAGQIGPMQNTRSSTTKHTVTAKYSRGALIRVTVEKDPEDGQLGLVPLIGELDVNRPQFTAMYVYNNRNYLKHVLFGDQLWRKSAVPFKFKFNNRFNRGIVGSLATRDLPQHVEDSYKQKILALLPQKVTRDDKSGTDQGLILTTEACDNLLVFRGTIPVVNLSKVWPEFVLPDNATEVFLDYRHYGELCRNIFSFIDFMPNLT